MKDEDPVSGLSALHYGRDSTAACDPVLFHVTSALYPSRAAPSQFRHTRPDMAATLDGTSSAGLTATSCRVVGMCWATRGRTRSRTRSEGEGGSLAPGYRLRAAPDGRWTMESFACPLQLQEEVSAGRDPSHVWVSGLLTVGPETERRTGGGAAGRG